MRNLYIMIIFATLGVANMVGCGKGEDDPLQSEKEAILGTWIQIEPSCIVCDTVIFSSDLEFQSNLYYINSSSYNFISKDSIGIDNKTLHYYFLDDFSELSIGDFITPDIGIERIDIKLTKID